MVKRVLVPLDGSLPATSALHAGERLADRWDAELHVLTLVKQGQGATGVNHIIERQVSRLQHRPRVDIRSLSYSIAEDIASEFDRVDDTLVVMSTWARGRSAGLMTNVAEDVLRLVRVPILLLGPEVEIDDHWPRGPMFITTDGSHFAESVVEPAVHMAELLGVELRLLTVVDPTAVPAGIDPAAEANAVARLSDAVEVLSGKPADYDVLHGQHPASAIVDYAERYGGALIAMSTHGRSGASRIALGSVAMDVVRHARCPVLLGRPLQDEHT